MNGALPYVVGYLPARAPNELPKTYGRVIIVHSSYKGGTTYCSIHGLAHEIGEYLGRMPVSFHRTGGTYQGTGGIIDR